MASLVTYIFIIIFDRTIEISIDIFSAWLISINSINVFTAMPIENLYYNVLYRAQQSVSKVYGFDLCNKKVGSYICLI